MARLARVIALDTPHHITQRGNGRQYILESDTDRLVYLIRVQIRVLRCFTWVAVSNRVCLR